MQTPPAKTYGIRLLAQRPQIPRAAPSTSAMRDMNTIAAQPASQSTQKKKIPFIQENDIRKKKN